MIDEIKAHAAATRGAQAAELMRNEMLIEAFDNLEKAYISEWRDAKLMVQRENLWMAVDVIGKVKDHLRTIISNGRLAQRELDNLHKTRKA